jgi:hypothetical protein
MEPPAGLELATCRLRNQLALHVASIPGALSRLAQLSEFDAANANFEPAMPESKEMVMNAFRSIFSEASAYLASLAPDSAGAPWRLTLRGAEVFSMPACRDAA